MLHVFILLSSATELNVILWWSLITKQLQCPTREHVQSNTFLDAPGVLGSSHFAHLDASSLFPIVIRHQPSLYRAPIEMSHWCCLYWICSFSALISHFLSTITGLSRGLVTQSSTAFSLEHKTSAHSVSMDLFFSQNIFYAVVLYKMLPVQHHFLTTVCCSHLSYKPGRPWHHWLPSFHQVCFPKLSFHTNQIPSSDIRALKAAGTALKFFLSSSLTTAR